MHTHTYRPTHKHTDRHAHIRPHVQPSTLSRACQIAYQMCCRHTRFAQRVVLQSSTFTYIFTIFSTPSCASSFIPSHNLLCSCLLVWNSSFSDVSSFLFSSALVCIVLHVFNYCMLIQQIHMFQLILPISRSHVYSKAPVTCWYPQVVTLTSSLSLSVSLFLSFCICFVSSLSLLLSESCVSLRAYGGSTSVVLLC